MTITRYTTYLIVIGVFFCTANSSEVKQAAAEKPKKLSNEVLSAMEGNQATLDSVRTVQATLTRKSAHSFGNIGSYKLTEKYKITSDGNHYRKDQLETKFTGDKVYRGYARALRVGRVDIDSAESNIDYIPSTNKVFVRPPRWSSRYKIRTNDILRYQSARGGTLKGNILASAKNGYYFTAKNETVDGDGCVLLACDYTNTETTLKIWVVPSKGYCIKRVQDISKGKIDDEYTTILKEYSPGIWWFDTVQAKRTSGLETVISWLSVDSLTFNEPIDPEIFTVWGIDVSSETKIWDEMQGTMYTLAIDDAKDAVVNPTSSSSKMLIVGLGILALVAIAFLSTFIKGKKVR